MFLLLGFPRALRACAQTAFRRRHWPASFLWSSPANAGYADQCGDSPILAVSAFCFPVPPVRNARAAMRERAKISAIARLGRKAQAACHACLPAAALRGAGRQEFGKARMLSRIATAGTYARQRQDEVPSCGCQYTDQPSQHWPNDPQKSVGQCWLANKKEQVKTTPTASLPRR